MRTTGIKQRLNKMKFLFLIFFVSVAQAELDPAVRFHNYGVPNISCPFFYRDNKWISQGPWYGFWGKQMVNVAIAYQEKYGGFGLCSTQFLDHENNQTLIKFIQYFSDDPFYVEPTDCQIEGAHNFKVLQAIKEPAIRGKTYEMTTEVFNPNSRVKKIKVFTYFLTEEESFDWVINYEKVDKKCMDMLPEAVPWEP